MGWEPRVPLVAAETVVDFPRINSHIVERRATLERAIHRPVVELADAMFLNMGLPSSRAYDSLRARLFKGLSMTYLFGFREARREIAAHRKASGVPLEEWESPQVNVSPYLHGFVAAGCETFVESLSRFYGDMDLKDPLLQTRMRDRAERFAHNMVLEQIGAVLNAGRTLAAFGRDEPSITAARRPARYAMRSEQLDKNTCVPCDTLHGLTAQVGTSDYFALLPPSGCLGRGRCRGVMVYSDDPNDFAPRRFL